MNGEISKLFRHIKAQGEQPGRELFCLPSGLATFTRFALRSAFSRPITMKSQSSKHCENKFLIVRKLFYNGLNLISNNRSCYTFLNVYLTVRRSLGQEVFCSVREADYEIASYARQHGSMGILGQDSDFIIYDRFVKY